jgi:hypothetical protein
MKFFCDTDGPMAIESKYFVIRGFEHFGKNALNKSQKRTINKRRELIMSQLKATGQVII